MSSTERDAEAQAEKFAKRKRTNHVYQLTPDPNLKATGGQQQADVEIVLFHGMQMPGSNPSHSYWRTWKMRNSEECWLETLLPELLEDEHSGRQYRARVLSVSYEGRADLGDDGLSKGTGATDEYLLVETLIQELIFSRNVKLGQRAGVPVFLVGHDLGGILIKQFVIKVDAVEALEIVGTQRQKQLRNFLTNLKSVFFYATPHAGSKILDEMVEKIPSTTRHKMVRFMKVLNAEKSRLNQAFYSYRQGPASLLSKFTAHAIRANYKTYLEAYKSYVEIVPEGSERSGVDSFYSDDADHFQVCQPEGTQSSSANMLANEIISVLQKQEASGSKAVEPPKATEIELRKEALRELAASSPNLLVVSLLTLQFWDKLQLEEEKATSIP